MSNEDDLKKRREEFKKAVEPLMKYINKNHHPHTKIIVDHTIAEIVEGKMSHVTEEFIVD